MSDLSDSTQRQEVPVVEQQPSQQPQPQPQPQSQPQPQPQQPEAQPPQVQQFQPVTFGNVRHPRRSPGVAGVLITSTFTLAGLLALVLIISYGLWNRQGPSAHFRGFFTAGLFLASATLLMLLLAALYRPLRRMRRLRAMKQMQQQQSQRR
jgi:hypothetical protein